MGPWGVKTVLGRWECSWGSERHGSRGGHLPGLAPMSKAESAARGLECLGWAAVKKQGANGGSWCSPCWEFC